jgi:hypothetical protein
MRGNIVANNSDRRGPRFVIRGLAIDNETQVEVICRFLPSAILRITVYAVNE